MIARRQIPNLLTAARVAAVPVCLAVMLFDSPCRDWVLLVVFTAAAITDALDGYLARRWNVTSAFGALWDPIADKFIVTLLLIYLVVDGKFAAAPEELTAAESRYPFITDIFLPVIVIILRELYVSGLREFLAARNVALPVSGGGKLKTAMQMLGITLALAAPVLVIPDLMTLGYIAIWIAAGAALSSAVRYTRASWKHLRS